MVWLIKVGISLLPVPVFRLGGLHSYLKQQLDYSLSCSKVNVQAFSTLLVVESFDKLYRTHKNSFKKKKIHIEYIKILLS